MSVGLLVTIAIAGTLIFGGGLTALIVSAVRRTIRRDLAELESEGIVLDSGSVHLTVRFRGFHSRGIVIGVGMRAGPGRLVLTHQRFCTIPIARRYASIGNVAREDLARFVVGTKDGGLLLRTDDPPNARGSVELVATVPDVEQWVRALTDAGARPLAA
jgi:hypothetical protein